MAVTPVGNPYVESSDLVANYPGTSQALAERIDVVGVNPFANAAARDASIPSPVEGQMTSLNDDDKVYRFSGSAWVAVGLPPGLNPVAPTSIANSGGSASTTGFTSTFSAVNSVSFNGVFSSEYTNYLIMAQFTSGALSLIGLRMRKAGTDASAANYNSQSLNISSTIVAATRVSSSSSHRFSTGEPAGTILTNAIMASPFETKNTIINDIPSGRLTNTIEMDFRVGNHTLTDSYDGITILGTTSFSGKITIYGYKN